MPLGIVGYIENRIGKLYLNLNLILSISSLLHRGYCKLSRLHPLGGSGLVAVICLYNAFPQMQPHRCMIPSGFYQRHWLSIRSQQGDTGRFLQKKHIVIRILHQFITQICLLAYPFIEISKDLVEYWDHNPDLAHDLRIFWGDSGPKTMQRVFPLRLYGDGADSIGLNSFELMSMMAVAPNHSSSLKSRFVLLQQQSGFITRFSFLLGRCLHI